MEPTTQPTIQKEPKELKSPQIEPVNNGLNLLNSEQKPYSPETVRLIENALNTEKALLILAEIILFILVGISYKLGSDLFNLDDQISSKQGVISEAINLEEEITKGYLRYTASSDIKNKNIKIYDRIGLVYRATPGEVTIIKLQYEDNILTLNLEAQGATNFAKLVNAYLQTKQVEKIVLRGATLKPESGIFNFNVDVLTKASL